MCRMASDTETCAAYLIETWNFNTFRVMFPSSTPNGFLTTENDCFEWCWKSPTKTRFGCCALVYFFAGSNLAGRMWNPIYRHVFRHFSTSRIRIWRRKKLLRTSWNWHRTSFWPSRVDHKIEMRMFFAISDRLCDLQPPEGPRSKKRVFILLLPMNISRSASFTWLVLLVQGR